VGAINLQLSNCPWLDVLAIDLNSRDERIRQCDYFSMQPGREYDVLVSSMVLNCVPQPQERGKMLRMHWEHLKTDGHLFLMIPLTCLRNSKYMNYASFVEILLAVGFHVREEKETPKLIFFCLQKSETQDLSSIHQVERVPPINRKMFDVIM
jgi:25S rRNA (adenine2142-N1)-methyltransferase